jgi:hypothetical protein
VNDLNFNRTLFDGILECSEDQLSKLEKTSDDCEGEI